MGCSPVDLLDMDLGLFNDTAAAVTSKLEAQTWTQADELLAVNAELTHALLVAFIKANSGKRPPHIEPLHIPRPGEQAKKPDVVNPADLVKLMGGGTVE